MGAELHPMGARMGRYITPFKPSARMRSVSRPSVRLSGTPYSATTRNKAAKKAIPTGSVPHCLDF